MSDRVETSDPARESVQMANHGCDCRIAGGSEPVAEGGGAVGGNPAAPGEKL
jgi:hypothetical protein